MTDTYGILSQFSKILYVMRRCTYNYPTDVGNKFFYHVVNRKSLSDLVRLENENLVSSYKYLDSLLGLIYLGEVGVKVFARHKKIKI